MKKRVKQIVSVMLITMMALQVLPMSAFTANAAETTGATWTDETTGIMYEYYGDISEFRTKTEDSYLKHPEEAGYVFAGWWTEESVSSSTGISDSAAAISVDKTDEGAWAKFVPEDVLTVKAQTSMKVSDALDKEGAVDEYGNLTANNGKGIKLRLVTSVDDNELYDEIGFKVKINSEQRIATEKFFEELTVTETEGASTMQPKAVFDANASSEFAVLVIGGFKTVANVNETALNVTPYWKTLDGTIVDGTNRARLLASDERANDEDGSASDFTVAGNKETYTYGLNTVAETVSYKYFLGASDSVYLKSTYTPSGANEKFGITIRNGGQTRQVLFSNAGVVITDGAVSEADNTYDDVYSSNGVYVWATKATKTDGVYAASASPITTMLGKTTETEVIWAIESNVLYGSVGGDVVLSIPMNVLCDKWLPGSYYQLGVAAYNEDINGTNAQLVFTKETPAFGKEALKKLLPESVDMATKTNISYEPITGSYMSAMRSDGTYCYGKEVKGTQMLEATIKVKAEDATTYSSNGITVKDASTGNSAQLVVEGKNKTARIMYKHAWANNVLVTSWLRNSAFTDDSLCNVKAVVNDDTLYVYYNGALTGSVDLYKLLPKYKEGNNIQLGICSWDAYQGMVTFSDVKFTTGEAAISATSLHDNYAWEIFTDLDGNTAIAGQSLTSSLDKASEKNVVKAATDNNNTMRCIYGVPTAMSQMLTAKITKNAASGSRDGFTIRCGTESAEILVNDVGKVLCTFYGRNWSTRFNFDNTKNDRLFLFSSSPYTASAPYSYEVTVVIHDEKLHIIYNNSQTERFVIPLTQVFANYSSGAEVSLGLMSYGWVNVTFTNVVFSAGKSVNEYYEAKDCADITKTFDINKKVLY